MNNNNDLFDNDDLFNDDDQFNSINDGGIEEPLFPDADAGLPDNINAPLDAGQGRGRPFVIGLIVLVVLLVLGLGGILIAAIQQGTTGRELQQTADAALATNNAVYTEIAGTSTAKSWTLTPSITPTPTFTATLTPSLTPTPMPTNTPTQDISGSLTPATFTPVPTISGASPEIIATVGFLTTQNAQLVQASTAFAFQIAANEASGGSGAALIPKRTQNAQFRLAQTVAAAQLTANSNIINSLSVSSSSELGDSTTPAAQPELTPLPSLPPVPSPTATTAAAAGKYVQMPYKQVDVTATAAILNTENAQLIQAQTAFAVQLTLNAIPAGSTETVVPQLTQNAQIGEAQTAIAVQLTANARGIGGAVTVTPSMPRTGLYEDIAQGKATPGNLAFVGFAAIGLVGVIVAARRMRVK